MATLREMSDAAARGQRSELEQNAIKIIAWCKNDLIEAANKGKTSYTTEITECAMSGLDMWVTDETGLVVTVVDKELGEIAVRSQRSSYRPHDIWVFKFTW
jgi:hypothetical protein